ncbi:MAG: DNA topoisomerase I, partial [Candidatus Aenigmatarchaeota archaeon]
MAYTLVIAEKPNAAKRIAEAIGKAKEIRKGKVRYWEVSWKGKQVLVVPAVGHLFILSEPGGRWVYPVFKVEWKPVFEIEKEAGWTRPYFKLIQELAKGAEEFIAATDFDLEGSVIAYNILRFICGTEKAKRMKFSTLTSQELREAFERPLPELDWPQVFAGLTRHELDFYWGINLSRALTLALKSAGGWKTLSIGRVQGPTLYLLFKRQAEIESFEPKPYWQI